MSTGLLNENAALRARLEAMEARISRPTPPAERDAIEAAKVRFDTVMAPLGVRAPDPTPGQTAEQYLRNRLRDAAEHSPRFSGEQFHGTSPAVLAEMEGRIYGDIQQTVRRKADGTPGALVEIRERDVSGRTITRYVGDPLTWMSPFMHRGASGSFNRKPEPGR